MKKTLLSMAMIAALVLTTMCSVAGSVSAAAEVGYTVETETTYKTITAGSEFTLSVSADYDMEAVQAMQVKLAYDKDVLQATNGEATGWLERMTLNTVNCTPEKQNDPNRGEVWITGMTLSNDVNVSAGEVFATVTFRALVDINTNVAVSIYYSKTGINGGTVWVQDNEPKHTDGGIVFVQTELCLLGDYNRNDMVDAMDVTRARQILLGRDPSDFESIIGDMDGSGSINAVDITRMRQVLLGMPWDQWISIPV